MALDQGRLKASCHQNRRASGSGLTGLRHRILSAYLYDFLYIGKTALLEDIMAQMNHLFGGNQYGNSSH